MICSAKPSRDMQLISELLAEPATPSPGHRFITCSQLDEMDFSPAFVRKAERLLASRRDSRRSPIPFIRGIVWDFIQASCVGHTGYIQDLPSTSGVYFVYAIHPGEKKLLYIGKAENLRKRWMKHGLRKMFESNDWYIIWKPLDGENFDNLEHEESAYITLLTPPLNRVARCGLGKTIREPESFHGLTGCVSLEDLL